MDVVGVMIGLDKGLLGLIGVWRWKDTLVSVVLGRASTICFRRFFLYLLFNVIMSSLAPSSAFSFRAWTLNRNEELPLWRRSLVTLPMDAGD